MRVIESGDGHCQLPFRFKAQGEYMSLEKVKPGYTKPWFLSDQLWQEDRGEQLRVG